MSQPNPPYQPYQQAPWPPAKRRKKWPWIVGGAVAFVLLLCGIGSALAGGGDEKPAATVQTTAQKAPEATTAQKPVATPAATKPATTAAAKPAPKKLTAAQEQAIGKAREYLDYTYFSRSGLIKQLKYEGFSTADATYAVDYLKVDWNKQAVGKAKDYLDYSHFSRSSLIKQLEYEGFTAAQAKYGATGAGL